MDRFPLLRRHPAIGRAAACAIMPPVDGTCVMLFNGVLNRLERYVLRWRRRGRAAAARTLT